MRNVLKKMMGVKFHITSYRVLPLRPFKRSVFGAQKCNFLHKWPNLQDRFRLTNLTLIFCMNNFFRAILCFWDIVTFSNFSVKKNLSVFSLFLSKMILISTDAQWWSELLYSWVFFCVILSLWVIVDLYFIIVNSDLGLKRLAGKQRSVALQNMPLPLTCSD